MNENGVTRNGMPEKRNGMKINANQMRNGMLGKKNGMKINANRMRNGMPGKRNGMKINANQMRNGGKINWRLRNCTANTTAQSAPWALVGVFIPKNPFVTVSKAFWKKPLM